MKIVFEDHVLDPERRELNHGAEVVAIGPQVFDLLLHLLRNRDRVVSKDDLIEGVWGGRIVSASTLTSHINAVRKAIGDSGEEQRLIRTIARKGYRFVGEVEEINVPKGVEPAGSHDPVPHVAIPVDRPSIAVLPFLNLSGDAEQEYFVDGVVEDIIIALSRIRWLLVIARNSSFTYKGRSVDERQVGRELGVRYILVGSVRKAGSRLRITGQLMDAVAGTNLWSERFEGSIDNIFDLQDEMTVNVVSAIAPQLQRIEIERAMRKPTENLSAYDYYLRGLANLNFGTQGAIDEALLQFYKSIELDPAYGAAHGLAAWCYVWRKVNGWMNDRAQEIAEGTRLARRTVELARDDAVALTRAGHALAHLAGDLDSGIALIDRAKQLNPNLAASWFLGGFLKVWNGDPEAAVAHFAQAMRLSPLDPEMYRMQAGMAVAYLFAGQFDEASSWAAKSFRNLPSFLMAACFIAASHALAGRMEEARRGMQHLRQLDPTLRVSNLIDYLPVRRPQDLAILADGLRKAGLPE